MAPPSITSSGASEEATCPCCNVYLSRHRFKSPNDSWAPTIPRTRPYIASRIFSKLERSATSSSSNCHKNCSGLLRLPSEIREMIWQMVLEPPPGARPAHFHIYERVVDHCTYNVPKDHLAEHYKNRGHLRQVALLSTSRLVYQEAVRFLYENAKFKLVIFPGYARPAKHLGSGCIGRLVDCEGLFRRMRHVTLVIQPGYKPLLNKFGERIREVLESLDYYKVQELVIHLNFRKDGLYTQLDPIFEAFKPVEDVIRQQQGVGSLRVKLRLPDGEAPQCEDYISELCRALGGWGHYDVDERSNPRQRHLKHFSGEDEWTDCLAQIDEDCIERGATGRHMTSGVSQSYEGLPLTTAGKLYVGSVCAAYLVLCPISVPVTVACAFYWQRKKGER